MDIGGVARRTGAYDLLEPFYSSRQEARWLRNGRPSPAPSSVKRRILRYYADRFDLKTLVETGTYKGDTVRALRNDFEQIHSIEIEPILLKAALARCAHQQNATLHLGDSSEQIPKILAKLASPALFWLDAHHSGGTTGGVGEAPIMTELRAILSSDGHRSRHVALIDDMRLFGTDPDYPSLDIVQQIADESSYDLLIESDIARLTPQGPS